VEKLLEVQPALSELGESLTEIIGRVEQAGKETVSIMNRNRELQTQITNLSGCRRILTETIAILDLVQQVVLLS
jgi:molybdopterin converting factor small subunit